MKKLILSLAVAALLVSCGGNSKQVMSDVPIKTEVLGVELNQEYSSSMVTSQIEAKTGVEFMCLEEKCGEGKTYRIIPELLTFKFGGFPWSYVDLVVDEESKIALVDIILSVDKNEQAKQQFDAVKTSLISNYGSGNDSDDLFYCTDGINTVGVSYYESSAFDGSTRYFCELVYFNIERRQAVAIGQISEL